jgi:hypothetical protein
MSVTNTAGIIAVIKGHRYPIKERGLSLPFVLKSLAAADLIALFGP